MFKKNDTIELHITDLSTGGEGIGKSDGFPFFVKNAVIGDEVEAVITKVHKRYGFAKVLRVKKESPWRVEPACPKAKQCGGCQIMQLSYEKQLEFKERMVKNNLQRIGGVEFAAESSARFYPIIGMEALKMPLHFRNKVQFPVGRNKEGHVITGFYAGRTHYIIETDHCPVSCEINDKILKSICSFLEENNIPVYEEADGSGLVRHVLIRNGFRTGQVMVCLVINGRSLNEAKKGSKKGTAAPDLDVLFADTLLSLFPAKELKPGEAVSNRKQAACETLTSISLNVNQKKTNVILGEEIIPLYGEPYMEDQISLKEKEPVSPEMEGQVSDTGDGAAQLKDLTFRISPLSFYQVNPAQTEKLYAKALEFAGLTGNETVWDLYCGIGTISLFLAQKARQVYGVEIVPDAILDAKVNAQINGITNAEFYCGDSANIFIEKIFGTDSAGTEEKTVAQTGQTAPCDAADEKRPAGQQTVDVVVLDPPRKGCDASLLEAVKKVGPEKIIYVSCDSATLARDLKILTTAEEGMASYQVKKVQPVDMFPHTCHVETVVLLSRVK